VSFPHSTDATHATGLLTVAPKGLTPSEHACLSLDALVCENSAKGRTFQRIAEDLAGEQPLFLA
jgi:hypothetical protein